MTKKNYIVLLKNKYLLFFDSKPVKKGSFIQGVKLFETNKTSTCQDICSWIEKGYQTEGVKEVSEWE